jgi:hypothetical protein
MRELKLTGKAGYLISRTLLHGSQVELLLRVHLFFVSGATQMKQTTLPIGGFG